MGAAKSVVQSIVDADENVQKIQRTLGLKWREPIKNKKHRPHQICFLCENPLFTSDENVHWSHWIGWGCDAIKKHAGGLTLRGELLAKILATLYTTEEVKSMLSLPAA